MALRTALFSTVLLSTVLVSNAAPSPNAAPNPNPPDNWDGGNWGDKDNSSSWGGGWGGNGGNFWMFSGDSCSSLKDDGPATSAYSCFDSAISSLKSKTSDSVWSTCAPAMDQKQSMDDAQWTSCLCSWALGPQAACISSACDGNGLSSYMASVTKDLSCSGTPTDAPIVAAGAVEGDTPGDGMGPRETGGPAAIAAGVLGIAAILL